MENNGFYQVLSIFNIGPGDVIMMLHMAQIGSAVLTFGLLINWIKTRHAGVLLSSAVFGMGAYTSLFTNCANEWWPLLVAFGSGWVLKGAGYHMGYH